MLALRFKKATLKRFTYLLLFLFLLIGLTLPFIVMAGDKDGLEKSKKDDLKAKDADFNKTEGGVKEGKSIWHLKEGFLLQNVTPETSVNGELVSVEYENDSKIGSLNVSFKFITGQAKIEFFEVLRNITINPTPNITNASLSTSEIKWVRTAPIILINGSFTSFMTNFTFGEKVRASPIPSVLGIFIKYDVSTCNGNDCNIIDPILYGSNIALTATNCFANATFNNVVNGTGNYNCQKLYDNAISPLTSCWVAGDNPSGTPNVQAYNSIQLNRSYDIGGINITGGSGGSYFAGNISVEFSTDSTNGKDDGNWTHKAWANMSSGDTSAVNLTNINGFGNATWVRFNVTNSSSTDTNKGIGLCEVLIYEFQAPAAADTLTMGVNGTNVTSFLKGQVVSFFANFTSTLTITNVTLQHNITADGTMTNVTIPASGTSFNASVNLTIQHGNTTQYGLKWYVNTSTIVNNSIPNFTITTSNSAPTIVHQIQLVNHSSQHSFNASFAVNDADGVTTLTQRNLSITAGTCSHLINSTTATQLNLTFNCTGTGLATARIQFNVSDSSNSGVASNELGTAYPDSLTVFNVSFPFGNANTSLNWINVTNVSDADGDVTTVRVFVNGTFNQTGTNVSLAATPEMNYVINVSISAGGNVTLNQTISYQFDNQSPRLGNGSNDFNLSGYISRNHVGLNFTWEEPLNTSSGMFIRNGSRGVVSNTSAFVNSSYFRYNFTNLDDANYTFSAWMNDSSGNVNETLNVSIVVDTIPPGIDFVSPTPGNGTVTAVNSSFNISWSITELYFRNLSVALFNTTHLINETWFTVRSGSINYTNYTGSNGIRDGDYVVNITAYDVVENKNVSLNRSFRIDVTVPSISNIFPSITNNTFISTTNVNLNASCSDDNLFSTNVSFKNLSNYLYTNFTDSISTKSYNVNVTFTVPRDGQYAMEVFCADDSTQSPPLGKYSASLTKTPHMESAVYNDPDAGVSFNISIDLLNPSPNNNTLSLQSFNISSSIDTSSGTEIKLLVTLNKTPTANTRLRLTFNEISGSVTYRTPASGLPFHFVIGNKFFHARDLADAGFSLTETNLGGKRILIITNGTWGNAPITLDPISGGLNQLGQESNLSVDTILPVPLFSTPTPANTTYTSLNRINISFNVTDANFKNVSVIISNDSGVLNNTWFTVPNSSLNYTLNDAHYTVVITAYDLANNSNTSILRNFTVDTMNPTLTLVGTYDTNNTVVGRNYIAINITMNETNRKNLTIRLKNGTATASEVNTSGNSTPLWNLFNFTGLADQRYNITVTATDLADNSNNTFPNISITVDTAAPNISIETPLQGAKVDPTFNIQFQVNDTIGVSQCNITSGVLGTITNGTALNVSNGNENNHINASGLLPGNQVSFSVRCVDYVGNSATTPVRTFSIAEKAGAVSGDSGGVHGDVTTKKQCATGELPFILNGTDYCTPCVGKVAIAGGKAYCVEPTAITQAGLSPFQTLPQSKGAMILMILTAAAYAVFGTNLIFKKKPKVKFDE